MTDGWRQAVEESRSELEALAESDLQSAKYAQVLISAVDDETEPADTEVMPTA